MKLQIGRLMSAWKRRGNRIEFWIAVAVFESISVAGRTVLHNALLGSSIALPLWFFFASRRLHDFGARAGWAFIPLGLGFALGFTRGFMHSQGVPNFMAEPIWSGLIGLLSVVEVVVVGAWPGNVRSNRFGPPPGQTAAAAIASEFS